MKQSRKRHLFITGGRQTGKSTLLARLRPLLSGDSPMPGITTRAIPGQCVILEDHTTGQSAIIGRFNGSLAGPGNQMEPVVEGFEGVGIPTLRRLAQAQGDWVFVDEIGYLESGSPAYQAALRQLLARKSVLAALRKQDTALIEELRSREDAFICDLDRTPPTLGCVIMASGMGVRFGSNKLLAPFCGQPLISRVLAATDTERIANRVVVTRHNEVAALCRDAGIDAVLHDLPDRSDTVRIGLESFGGDLPDGCMFCPGDQPLLTRASVESLAQAFIDEPDRIWRLAYQDTPGSPVIFPKRLFQPLRTLPRGKGGSYVVRASGEAAGLVQAQSIWELKDVDSPRDLELLQNRCSAT